MLNGCTFNDSPANFTFSSPQKTSIVDLVWVSSEALPIILDMQILQLTTLSDHFPLFVTLTFPMFSPSSDISIKLHFDPNKAELFSSSMSWMKEVGDLSGDIDYLNNNNIISTVKDIALGTEMWKYSGAGLGRKPWMDSECKEAKKRVTALINDCKRNNFSNTSKELFHKEKTNYKKILKVKEKNFISARIEAVNNFKDASQFWKGVNSSRPKTFFPFLY